MALTLDGTIGVSATGNLLAAGYMASQPVSLTSAVGNVYAGNVIAQPYPVPTGLNICLLYTSPSPRDGLLSRMPSSA